MKNRSLSMIVDLAILALALVMFESCGRGMNNATATNDEETVEYIEDEQWIDDGDMEENDIPQESDELTDSTYRGYGYVDLGLPSGTLWAVKDIGARSPATMGKFYAWGELEPKEEFSHTNYRFYDPNWRQNYGAKDKLGKMRLYSKYWDCDELRTEEDRNRVILNLEDDVAHCEYGGRWRLPTIEDIIELREYCTAQPSTYGDQSYGVMLTGPNGNELFLPAAGHCNNKYRDDTGKFGYFWSSTLYLDGNINYNVNVGEERKRFYIRGERNYDAFCMIAHTTWNPIYQITTKGEIRLQTESRTIGANVRPVFSPAK